MLMNEYLENGIIQMNHFKIEYSAIQTAVLSKLWILYIGILKYLMKSSGHNESKALSDETLWKY